MFCGAFKCRTCRQGYCQFLNNCTWILSQYIGLDFTALCRVELGARLKFKVVDILVQIAVV